MPAAVVAVLVVLVTLGFCTNLLLAQSLLGGIQKNPTSDCWQHAVVESVVVDVAVVLPEAQQMMQEPREHALSS